MALTRDQIDDLAEEGVFLGNIYEIAQAVEAEVRKDDDALIRQMLDALDDLKGYRPDIDAAITAAKARLGGHRVNDLPKLTAQEQAEILRLVRRVEAAARDAARLKYGAGVTKVRSSKTPSAYADLKDYLKEL